MENNTSNTQKFVHQKPLLDVLQVMINEDIPHIQLALKSADSEESVNRVLKEIQDYPVDCRLPESVKGIFMDLKGNARLIPMGDYTRQNLLNDFGKLIDALFCAIPSEIRKDHIEIVRTFLLVMAEHAEEVTDWLEEALVKKESSENSMQ